jgi:hypothetical protein
MAPSTAERKNDTIKMPLASAIVYSHRSKRLSRAIQPDDVCVRAVAVSAAVAPLWRVVAEPGSAALACSEAGKVLLDSFEYVERSFPVPGSTCSPVE